MQVLLTTLNSKYIHSSLSIRYLKSYCDDLDVEISVEEYTINQHNDYITGEIFKRNPDVVAFGCYIWNLENVLEIAQRLKLVKPDITIVLGGPEVSFEFEELIREHSFIDYIIYGEGEETFRELLIELQGEASSLKKVQGLAYLDKGQVVVNPPRPLIDDLDKIPTPFEERIDDFKNRIIYYESSRGCPFGCKFCLSSTIQGVRFFSLERVKDDLKKLIQAQVKQVKFVDRTFNTRKEYAMEIMKFIIDQKVEGINFHFEVTAHLLDEEMLTFLKGAPEGLFQFEIGVQSTNPETIKSIGRTTDFEKLSRVVETIKSYKNIHQHLDLIAGLPCEGYESFKHSFNDVYALRPDKLQLGFLKLLKGSELRAQKEEHGFKFIDEPTYEVMANNYISYGEMLKLKTIEDLVEKYGNDSSFKHSIETLITNYYLSPFDFYEAFSEYWENKAYHTRSHSKKNLYKILFEFHKEKFEQNHELFVEVMKYDYLFHHRNTNLPLYLENVDYEETKGLRHDFLKREDYIEKYLFEYRSLSAKKILQVVAFQPFKFDILRFIKEGYPMHNKELIKEQQRVILFKYMDKNRVFNQCVVKDITKECEDVR